MTTTVKCSWLSYWTAKQQISSNNFIYLKSSVSNRVSPVKVCFHPALTPITETPVSSSLTSLPENENSSSPGLSYPASTPHPDSLSPTPPCPFVPTLDPPAQTLRPRSLPQPPRFQSDIYFGPGIKEALMYGNLEQKPYPPPAAQEADDLASTSKSTLEAIH